MNKYLKNLLASIGLATLSFGFDGPTYSATRYESVNKPGVSPKFYESSQNESKRNTSFRFLTNVNASIGAAGVSGGDYTARIRRELQFDAFRITDWTLQFAIREQSLLDPSPSQLDHVFTYLGIGYEIANGRMTFFWDHTCYNPSRELPENRRNDIHWNELGIKYETTAMMLGHKNDEIKSYSGSEWLKSINWRASLSKIWMRTENDYEWMGKLDIRYDIFRYGRQVFYIQPGLNSIYDNRGFNQDYRLEIGDRISWNKSIYFIAFLSFEHFHDWYALGKGEDFFLAGLRLETGLNHEDTSSFSNPGKTKISLTPKFHVTGGYTNILDNENWGHSSDLAFDLDLLEFRQDKRLILNAYAGILTLPDDLNPARVKYEIGPSLEINLDNFDLRFFHSYSCLYGLEDQGVIRDYNLLGLGVKNNNAPHLNWNVKIGVYPSTKNFDYWGDLQGSAGYDFYERGISPYIYYSGHYLQGDSSVLGHAIEAGAKIPGDTGTASVYLRLQNDFDVFRFGEGNQTLLGIRFKFQ